MIGLTAGLVIEGRTGKSILVQVKLHSDFLCSCSSCLLCFYWNLLSSAGWLLECYCQLFHAIEIIWMFGWRISDSLLYHSLQSYAYNLLNNCCICQHIYTLYVVLVSQHLCCPVYNSLWHSFHLELYWVEEFRFCYSALVKIISIFGLAQKIWSRVWWML